MGQRVLFSVVPEGELWSVKVDSHTFARFASKLAALDKADGLAYTANRYTAAPTGVEVRMLCGDAVLSSCYG
jgi:hypothetical protein